MTYVDGFVAAVPKANKERYIAHAKTAAALFKQWGAIRVTENWGDAVPKGKLNDFYTAVHAEDDEVVVFSWIEYPDKATRDIVQHKMMNDPAMTSMTDMPFDTRRMIFAGFSTVLDV